MLDEPIWRRVREIPRSPQHIDLPRSSNNTGSLIGNDIAKASKGEAATMKGKTVVITGATSGIGQVAAEQLAARGGRMILIARDDGRAKAALDRLRSTAPGLDHAVYLADLSVVSETKRVAAEIASQRQPVDVLINNVGAMFSKRSLTRDGLERTFATNHLSYFVLTLGLLDALAAAPSARIVNTASAAHAKASLDFEDLQSARRYSAFDVYGKSKLCNILFTRELARRLQTRGIVANCLHPGFVATRFGDQSGGLLSLGVRFAKLFAISPEKGARTIIYLASAPEAAHISGKYFFDLKPIDPSDAAQDDSAAALLWSKSIELANLPPVAARLPPLLQ
jgi:NAD(P)-dependent dehydrogenase (short-subunit alcohol dehydrogenase family)